MELGVVSCESITFSIYDSRVWYPFEVKSTSYMLYILINICKLYVGKEANNYSIIKSKYLNALI